jgi:hypothetical protein
MSFDSTLPRAVAEWQLRNHARAPRRPAFGDFSDEFAGVTSFRMLQALTPAEAAARWLEASHPVTRIRRMLAEQNCGASLADSIANSAFHGFKVRTIGAVVVGDSTAYVLVTDGYAGDVGEAIHARMPAALRLRRRPDGWRLLPSLQMMAGGASYGLAHGCPGR